LSINNVFNRVLAVNIETLRPAEPEPITIMSYFDCMYLQ
jgi:hypothetical protein